MKKILIILLCLPRLVYSHYFDKAKANKERVTLDIEQIKIQTL